MWNDDDAYEVGSYKRSAFFDNAADYADDARKRARENGIPNPIVEQWKGEQEALALKLGPCGTVDCIMPAGHTGGCFICR